MAKQIVSILHKFRLVGEISFRKDYSPPSSPPSRPYTVADLSLACALLDPSPSVLPAAPATLDPAGLGAAASEESSSPAQAERSSVARVGKVRRTRTALGGGAGAHEGAAGEAARLAVARVQAGLATARPRSCHRRWSYWSHRGSEPPYQRTQP